MNILDNYFELQQKIYDYFGYQEDWLVIPIEDRREYVWVLNEQGGTVGFAKEPITEDLMEKGEYYEDEIFTYRHLSKWVYEAEDYTMILVDTHTDGNKFLAIFSNAKRQKEAI